MKTVNSLFRPAAVVAALLCGVLISSARAQENQAPVNFSYSYATFAGNGDTSVVEFSYSFSEDGLTYVKGIGRLLIELQLFDSTGKLRDSYVWEASHALPKQGVEGLTGKIISTVQRFRALPGMYTVDLRLIDGGDPKRVDSTRFGMNVRSFAGDRIGVSDLELITEMAPAAKGGAEHPGQRNGYVLVRNVDAIVTGPSYRLNSYVEIYNTNRLPASEFHISYLIADSTGRGLYRRDTLLRKTSEGRTFDVNSVVVNGLATGWYLIAARVFDGPRSLATDSVEVVRPFWIYNPRRDSVIASADEFVFDSSSIGGVIDPIYAGMTEDELDVEFRKAAFIMSKHQQNIWRQLSGIEGKGRFLTRFWMLLDDDPATPENAFRDDYYSRVNYAKKLYSSAIHQNGWDSDRGRVLLQYGKPDQIDRHFNEHNRKPYEIWHYTSVRYDFVFVDRTQTDNYQLVHSTAPNEISFPEWEGETAALHKQMYQGEFNSSPYNR